MRGPTNSCAEPINLHLPLPKPHHGKYNFSGKLAEYCRRRRLLPEVTDEWVRRLLRREGLTAQRVRTWKTSHDPAFDPKKKLIRKLYQFGPPRNSVVCFDEWVLSGVSLGSREATVAHPSNLSSTEGTEQFLGFYDVHADCLSGLFRRRKTVREISEAFYRLRCCYPGKRLWTRGGECVYLYPMRKSPMRRALTPVCPLFSMS
jgi:hypothetical protein